MGLQSLEEENTRLREKNVALEAILVKKDKSIQIARDNIKEKKNEIKSLRKKMESLEQNEHLLQKADEEKIECMKKIRSLNAKLAEKKKTETAMYKEMLKMIKEAEIEMKNMQLKCSKAEKEAEKLTYMIAKGEFNCSI